MGIASVFWARMRAIRERVGTRRRRVKMRMRRMVKGMKRKMRRMGIKRMEMRMRRRIRRSVKTVGNINGSSLTREGSRAKDEEEINETFNKLVA